jgi:uncharacterized membrane protein YfcA
MMLFFKAKRKEVQRSHAQEIGTGATVGGIAGYLGGLLGVGGGNFIVPALVWLGFDPKKASATTAFIVIFSSLAGFLGHTAMGNINVPLLALSALGSIAGAYLGAWLLARKLQSAQVKTIIGVVLYVIAARMLWGLMGWREKGEQIWLKKFWARVDIN